MHDHETTEPIERQLNRMPLHAVQTSNFRIHGDEGALFEALAVAQAAYNPVKRSQTAKVSGRTKDGTPFSYDFDFADLNDYVAATRPALNAAGIAAIMPPYTAKDRMVEVRVVLGHAKGRMEAIAEYPRPEKIQELGSLVTYLTRYLYRGLVGAVAEGDDDDGNEADGNKAAISKRPQSAPTQKAEPKPKATPKADPKPAAEAPSAPEGKLSKETYQLIREQLVRTGKRGGKVAEHCKECTSRENPDILFEDASGEVLGQTWLTALRALPDAAPKAEGATGASA
jgi:hypothetical protein